MADRRSPAKRAQPPGWSQQLRALREARAITQDGWAARLRVGRTTVQRWESGTAPPGAEGEAALLRVCAELGLFRRFDHGPLQGLTLTPDLLSALIADARLGDAGAGSASPSSNSGPAAIAPLPAAMSGNLPAVASSFIGRGQEIDAVLALLGEARLVTLTGPGGIGKTRLSLAIAERAGSMVDDAWFIDLSPVGSAALVVQQVAAVFGIVEQPRRQISAVLVERLREARSLLVLDNCEHLIDASAELAGLLLRSCPRLRILATSRQSLGIDGESAWRVPPLALPDAQAESADAERYEAVRLFVERARAMESGFVLTPANTGSVAQICREVDGMPLAIELAAARARVLSVQQIAERLDDRLRLLSAGPRGLPERQRTLRATLDWSYDLLDASERALLRRSAVFFGGFDLDAAEAVCAGSDLAPDAVLDALDRLADKSLIGVDTTTGMARYRLLEMVRQYALDRLAEANERAEYNARHAAWGLALALRAEAEAQGAEQRRWLDRLSLDHDNLRAALEWSLSADGEPETGLRLATALRPFWFTRGYASEGRRWLARLLAVGGSTDVQARALDAAAALAHSQGDLGVAGQLLSNSLAQWQALGDRAGAATALNLLGIVEKDRGNLAAATAALEEALAIRRAQGERGRVSAILNNLAAVAMDAAAYNQAVALLEESLAIKRELGDRVGVAVSLANLAETARLSGDFRRAVELAEEAQALAGELGVPLRRAQHLHVVGVSLARLGEFGRARAALVEALEIFARLDTRVGAALCCEGLAQVAVATGNERWAAWLIGAAEAVRQQLGAPLTDADRADCERVLAEARLALGEELCAVAVNTSRALPVEEILSTVLREFAAP
jgi:predicted ATPase/DNA-binding XRE family transcriptional regulator